MLAVGFLFHFFIIIILIIIICLSEGTSVTKCKTLRCQLFFSVPNHNTDNCLGFSPHANMHISHQLSAFCRTISVIKWPVLTKIGNTINILTVYRKPKYALPNSYYEIAAILANKPLVVTLIQTQ